MGFIEIVGIIIICLCVGGATLYIIKAKKEGQKCIGCPYAKQCKANKAKCDCDKK